MHGKIDKHLAAGDIDDPGGSVERAEQQRLAVGQRAQDIEAPAMPVDRRAVSGSIHVPGAYGAVIGGGVERA